MRPLLTFFVAGMLFFTACNYVTYSPRTKTSFRREHPSAVILSNIVDFRVEQQRWPISVEDMISKGKKYAEPFKDFPYTYTHFKIVDSNSMIFYFSGHKDDVKNYNESGLIDLNSYSGSAKFYKWNDKFVWKLNMR